MAAQCSASEAQLMSSLKLNNFELNSSEKAIKVFLMACFYETRKVETWFIIAQSIVREGALYVEPVKYSRVLLRFFL